MKAQLLAALALTAAACGGSSPSSPSPAPTPVPVTRAVVTATAAPNPVIVTPCTSSTCSPGFAFLGSMTVTVRESAGLGGNVDFVNLTLRNATTGIEVGTLNYSAPDVIARAGTNHVNAGASLDIPRIGIQYSLSGGGRQATVTIAVQFTDDMGNRSNLTITVPFV